MDDGDGCTIMGMYLKLLNCTLKKNKSTVSVKSEAAQSGIVIGLGRSPGEGNGNPLQYSGLGNPMNRGAWRATVRGVTRVRHDLATKPFCTLISYRSLVFHMK